MHTEKCPKCGGIAHYEIDKEDVILRCICGLYKFLTTTQDEITIDNRLDKRDTRLPKHGSKLSIVLGVVAGKNPEKVTTEYIAVTTNENKNDVSSRLIVLYHRQLIEKVSEGRGFKGGSEWVLSEEGVRLLGVRITK